MMPLTISFYIVSMKLCISYHLSDLASIYFIICALCTFQMLDFTPHTLSLYRVGNYCYTWIQVLLATGGGHLVYLEIGDGILQEVKHAQLEYEVSCLDINPIGENPNQSHLAAVGMWTDISVRIFSLPDLNLITKEHLGGEIIPRSVLLCAFEGVRFP